MDAWLPFRGKEENNDFMVAAVRWFGGVDVAVDKKWRVFIIRESRHALNKILSRIIQIRSHVLGRVPDCDSAKLEAHTPCFDKKDTYVNVVNFLT